MMGLCGRCAPTHPNSLQALRATGLAERTLVVFSSDNGTTQQVKATLPAGGNGKRFVRLRVTGAP